MAPVSRTAAVSLIGLVLLAQAGCATRAVDVKPTPSNPAEFALWNCNRIHDERDAVQQRAADVAYAVDQRAGHNILALGVGLAVFWPVLLAMRPDGLEAADLARLKGRYEALGEAAQLKACAPPDVELSAERAAQLPLALGERLVYEERQGTKGPTEQLVLQLTALRRIEFEFHRVEVTSLPGARAAAVEADPWLQDRAGNLVQAPVGQLQWPKLLQSELVLGQVNAGELRLAGDPLVRARVRTQVVAIGPQTVAGRRFEVAVLELFGDATNGESFTRLEGAIVIDRISGVLLRLDLRSAHPVFSLQRRLMRVDPARGVKESAASPATSPTTSPTEGPATKPAPPGG